MSERPHLEYNKLCKYFKILFELWMKANLSGSLGTGMSCQFSISQHNTSSQVFFRTRKLLVAVSWKIGHRAFSVENVRPNVLSIE